MYKRKCSECGREIPYTNEESYNRATKHKTKCMSCCKSGISNHMFGKQRTDKEKQNISESLKGEKHPMYGRKRPKHSEKMIGENNPMFGRHHTKKTKKILSEQKQGKKNPEQSKRMLGENNPSKRVDVRRKLSENTTGKNNPMYGKKRTYEEKRKLSEANKGVKRSEETRKNMRLSAIKRIEKAKFNGGQLIPGYNPEACKIIDEYGEKHGYNFQHAENGGEVCIGGYFPDGLDAERETIIEIDEKQHFNVDGTYIKKDIKRQKYLENLGYKMIRLTI